ncbi:MAG: oligosaccharide flippase family protein, partial [Butyrivibrio sp.]|nr:oligosaccharide flippase family protein [Butyrivibrio sp.]
ILLPFITRTVMIRTLGMKYLGLNSLFTSILSMLNLAELGVGSAMVFSMYEPVANDDKEKVCALLNLYRLYYRIIGLVIGVVGVGLIPFLPKLIKGSVPPDIDLTALYLLNLGATVLSYWLLAYRGSVLSAHQREDVASKVRIVMTIIQNILQIVLLFILPNYYYYVIITLFIQVCTNVTIAFFAKKLYPEYSPRGKLDKEVAGDINRRIADLFTSRLGSVIFSSVDSMVISTFLGLEMVAIYHNYYYVANALIGILQVVYQACMAGIGNSIITETREKNFKDLNKLTFIIGWAAGFCSCCLVAMYQPFIRLWAGEESLQPFGFVVCMAIFFFVWEMYRLLNVYKDAAGIWHDDRFRPLASALTNLAINIITVRYWGLYGIILSTVLSVLFVGTPWLIHNIFNTIFDVKYRGSYLKKVAFYTVVTTLACTINYLVCRLVPGKDLFVLIIRAVISCIIPNVIYFLFYFRTKEFDDALSLVSNLTGGRINLKRS